VLGSPAGLASEGDITLSGYQTSGGTWRASGGVLTLTDPDTAGDANGTNAAVRRGTVSGDFDLTVQGQAVATTSAWDDFSVILGHTGPRDYYAASFNESNDTGTHGLFRVRDGISTELADFPGSASAGQPHTIRVTRSGDRLTVALDGRTMVRTRLVLGRGRLGVGTRNNRAAFTTVHVASGYDEAVLADRPVGYWANAAGTDLVGRRDAVTVGGGGFTSLPNGDTAATYDGTQYLEVADHDRWSPSTTGVLTVEAWVRPSTLEFTNGERDDCYVHWLGKGGPGEHEWVARMYSRTTACETPSRPNRVSMYAFNRSGGLGTGAYFQGGLDGVPAMQVGEWILVTGVVNSLAKSPAYPNGYVRIYRNGRLVNTRDLSSTVPVTLENGTAPLRFGTRDLASFFQGALGKVAVYGHELSAARVRAHFDAM
jgi:hypothetical protein